MNRLRLVTIAIAASGLALIAPAATQVRAIEDVSVPLNPLPSQAAPALVADGHLDLVDTAEQYGLTTFVSLLETLGIAEDLRGYGRFTVFAPSDSAFSEFLAANPQFQGGLTAEQRDQLATLLSYHIIVRAEPITTDSFVTVLGSRSSAQRTLARPDLNLRLRRSSLYANDVRATESDIRATNGVIHVINQVLTLPEGAL